VQQVLWVQRLLQQAKIVAVGPRLVQHLFRGG
jgi:hypothetical protein